MQVEDDLVYDLGMHEAQDTGFYLAKGFRVVAVDANDRLCEQAAAKFAPFVAEGRLTILNCAIAREAGVVTFYDNVNSVWGTIDPDWAARNARVGAPSRTHDVPAMTTEQIISEHGLPHYMKIDIEGMDLVALEGLRNVPTRPTYVSLESEKVSFRQLRHEFELFDELGYDQFKVVSQRVVPKQRLPHPAREGKEIEYRFVPGSSGAFGEEAPGQWLTADGAIERYRSVFLQYALTGDDPFIRSRALRLVLRSAGFRTNWFDTHAKLRKELR